MKHLTIREMRAALPHIEELMAREGEILLTRHGRPIARLLPVERPVRMPSHAVLRATMPRLAIGSEVVLRRDRDER